MSEKAPLQNSLRKRSGRSAIEIVRIKISFRPNGQKLIGQQVIRDPAYQSLYRVGRRAVAMTAIRMLPCG